MLRPVVIQFPAAGLSPQNQELFRSHLAEHQAELNQLSLTRTNDLRINLSNYYNVKPLVQLSRRLARMFLPGSGIGRDAAHSLDAVAGGYPNKFVGFRSPVQQRIGSLWRTRRAQIEPGREHILVPNFDEESP
jgi:hypothetical protein